MAGKKRLRDNFGEAGTKSMFRKYEGKGKRERKANRTTKDRAEDLDKGGNA